MKNKNTSTNADIVTTYCMRCGNTSRTGAQFCTSCGAALRALSKKELKKIAFKENKSGPVFFILSLVISAVICAALCCCYVAKTGNALVPSDILIAAAVSLIPGFFHGGIIPGYINLKGTFSDTFELALSAALFVPLITWPLGIVILGLGLVVAPMLSGWFFVLRDTFRYIKARIRISRMK